MRRPTRRLASILLVLCLNLLLASTGVQAQGGSVHLVRPGETLTTIALLYGVTPTAIAEANRLRDPDLILAGQQLIIPAPGLSGETTYVVRPGDSLSVIAEDYGVESAQLAADNGLSDPDRISVGQVLRIAAPGPAPRTTAVIPGPLPFKLAAVSTRVECPCEEIVILAPTANMTVTNPVTVMGQGSGFEQTVIITILDGSGGQIGQAPTSVVGTYGAQGIFSATVPFAVTANSQLGRIQVWSESPRDGAIEHLNSTTVMLQGLDLDLLLEQLDVAIRARDYAALQRTMRDPFQVRVDDSPGVSLTPSQAAALLQQVYLGPGAPRLDFSVDGHQRLDDLVKFTPNVLHVVYSVGWGAKQGDEAFLLIDNVDGRARWIGMVYVSH